ncbi:MAG: uracil-DNA glycosylase [Planctomycetota bacterium]|nr:uracil-DNA glycosylase [Planctomycetota bacterium]
MASPSATSRLRRQVVEMDAALGVVGSPRRNATAVAATVVAATTVAATTVAATVVVEDSNQFISSLQDIVSNGTNAQSRLDALDLYHAAHCPHCLHATGHTRLVFGEGNPDARLMFIGEAPGETEDQLGRPFVGRAGQKLDEMICAMGFTRESVYIANVLKSRPPENRAPMPAEIDLCGPTLSAQIAIIAPSVIVTLGAPATKLILQTDVAISKLRGVWDSWKPPSWLQNKASVPVMPTFHPAYLLRNYTPKTRQEVWSDLQEAMTRLPKR